MKKQVSFRLDEELIEALEYITNKYPRFSLTDIVDLALKQFLHISVADKESKDWLDKVIGKYMRGEYDRLTNQHHKTFVLPEKKRQLKK